MLIIDNIHVSYGKCEALKGLSLSLEPGTVHGLSGINGSGKTTLLNALYGFVRPAEGQVTLHGLPLQRKDIAFLETENHFYPYITGREYLGLFPKSNKFNSEAWADIFSIPLDDVTENYSTGMRKKVAIVATIQSDKPVVLLDEPFNGLDSHSVTNLYALLDRLRQNGTITLLTAHIYELFGGCCTQIHHLKNGRIAEE